MNTILQKRIEEAAKNYENHLALPEWDRKEIHGIDFMKGAFSAIQIIMSMMISGDVVKNINNQLLVESEPIKDTFNDLKFGDKVKLIIIKDEHNTTTKD